MEGVAVGRIVHYRGTDLRNGGCVAAMIVQEWGEAGGENGNVNLTLFPDWSNDRTPGPSREAQSGVAWRTSIAYSEGDREDGGPSWHWPERA